MSTTNNVLVWQETVTIPTYKTHNPEKSPLFIENRAYQGSTGKVYPLPVTEKINDVKENVTYEAIFLENDFLQLMILPELGGRIQRAYDKTNDYDFVYYNQVIKPALVGLTGPWISGGIEFNWPQHHRPSTYCPVDSCFTKNEDGSATVHVSEIDKMYGTKGMASFTLYPDKAYIEINGQLFNNTDTPQTFLWWANPAVPVNDNTYSVFPPDVHAVMDHGKRAVSTFPIATGEYYKYDYSEGIDISMYKNVEVPTSYMAASSNYDFIGNYDTEKRAGLLHVADHHISPGKKQWTWGNADFGQAWDRCLTDEDGPYIELMTGVFADNQPDFTWLKPYEEKTFTQYFMPYKGVGRVKNATKDAMVNFEIKDQKGTLSFYTSGVYSNVHLTIILEDTVLYETTLTSDPTSFFEDSFSTTLESPVGCVVTAISDTGATLVSFKFEEETLEATPDPADPLLPPSDLKTTEELFLGAQHLEQYRHATYEPADYYEEGLRRDPTDLRLNNGYGLLQFKRGNLELAKKHFQSAIEKQTWKNPNPYNGECYFNLGLVNFYLGNYNASFDAFYKATWSQETSSAGFYWLATLACRKKNYEQGLTFIQQSLVGNWHNMKARTLKISILRALGHSVEHTLTESLEIDPLYMGCLYENSLRANDFTTWIQSMRDDSHNYLELSLHYMKAGFYEDSLTILESAPHPSALIYYYKGYVQEQMGNTSLAFEQYTFAEVETPDYCFPNKIEEQLILSSAIRFLDSAPYAHYYLGNLLYDKKQYQAATTEWELSVSENSTYAMTHRNLAIAYYNKENNPTKALTSMKRAFNLEPTHPRFLLEYDQLCAKNKLSITERLAFLTSHIDVVKQRDVLYLEYITLLNETKQYEEALSSIKKHVFRTWEGGEGKVSGQYRYALTSLAIQEIENKNYYEALTLLTDTLTYPENLGEGKLPNTLDNIAYYYMAKCYDTIGAKDDAISYYQKASVGLDKPDVVLYYNDQPSDVMLYQGLAHQALGNHKEAMKAFHQLKAFGEKHIFDTVSHDYFAVSLPELEVFPDNIQTRNDIYCEYLMALAEIGLGNYKTATEKLELILDKQPNYQGAIWHLEFLSRC